MREAGARSQRPKPCKNAVVIDWYVFTYMNGGNFDGIGKWSEQRILADDYDVFSVAIVYK